MAFPVDEKRPRVLAFNDWVGLPISAISEWSRKWPNSNVGLGTRAAALVVLDADDPSVLALFRAIAGETPLKVVTPGGGEHWYFRDLSGEFPGVIRPGGRLYDIKGALRGDFVVLPGSRSESRRRSYVLEGDPDCHPPSAFSALLKQVPPLSTEAYRELARLPAGTTTVAIPRPRSGVLDMKGGQKIVEGARNTNLFKWACREAHGALALFGPTLGSSELLARACALNDNRFEPPLGEAEVRTVVNSAWRRTIDGSNRRRRRRLLPCREILIELSGHSRAVTLLAYLTEAADVGLVEFSASAWSSADVIPGWTRSDYQAALAHLVDRRLVLTVVAPRRGRGARAVYRISRPFSAADLRPLMSSLDGNADAAALYLATVELWGLDRVATLAARSMVSMFGGPFSNWTERRMRTARTALETIGLLERLEAAWSGQNRRRPCQFWVRAPFVLVRAENAPDRTRMDTAPRWVGGSLEADRII